MWKDPIVEEVQKNRREIEESCGNDFDKLFNKIKEREKKIKDLLITEPLKDSQKEIKKSENKI